MPNFTHQISNKKEKLIWFLKYVLLIRSMWLIYNCLKENIAYLIGLFIFYLNNSCCKEYWVINVWIVKCELM